MPVEIQEDVFTQSDITCQPLQVIASSGCFVIGAIPEAGRDEESALSDTDEGSANTGAAARLAKLARSYLCITATRRLVLKLYVDAVKEPQI
ncbi:unnamed protein product [Pleuronectes platessa]|uniref:Uncharacterized protein n=1 Tax=Pleuronectes platessa TaxID=8262 RepID=A0A9N7YA95_PLEPL|nr:unnamed protein product [Pleuronectes platessa]